MSPGRAPRNVVDPPALFESHESFVNLVMLPYIVALLCPLVVGSFQSLGIVFVDKSMLITLVAACVVTVIFAVSLNWVSKIKASHLVGNLITHGVTLSLGCVFLGADIFGTLILPLTFILVVHGVWPLSDRKAVVKLIAYSALLVILTAGVSYLQNPNEQRALGIGALVFLVAALFALMRRRYGGAMASAPEDVSPALKSLIGTQHEQEVANVYFQCRLSIAKEIAAEFVWRLPLFALAVGAGVFWLAYANGMVSSRFAISWITFAVMFLGGLLGLLLTASIIGVYRVSFLIVIAIFGWLSLGFAFHIAPLALLNGVFFVCVLVTSAFPWNRRWLTLLLLLYIIMGGLQAIGHHYQLVFFLLLLTTVTVAVRLGLNSRVSVLAKVVLPIMIHLCNTLNSVRTTVRLFSWLYCWLVDARRVLVVVGSNDGFTVGPSVGTEVSKVDPAFLTKLVQVASTGGKSDYILSFERDLGPQFLTPCVDWFDYVPKYIIASELNAVLDGREERIVVLVPLSNSVYFAGLDQVIRAARSIASIVRNSLAASRLRLMSSDVLLSTQKNLAAQAEDLDELVHVANNVAQDVGSRLERFFVDSTENIGKENVEALAGVRDLVSDLSVGVSDVQWLREISKIKTHAANQRCNIAEFFEDNTARIRRWCERRGVTLAINIAPAVRGSVIWCASQEYFSAALRALVRAYIKGMTKGETLVVSVNKNNEQVEIAVSCSVINSTSVLDRRLLGFALSYFRGKCGELREDKTKGFQVIVACHCAPIEKVVRGPDLEAVNWMMIVDDTPEVLNFYARVAEALGVRFQRADSVASAKAVVAQHGIPDLLLTDIQLGDGSGLDLLRGLKKESAGKMRSIVVSGKVDGGIASEVRAAGGDRHLAKPVGRKRLFECIKELTGRG